MELLLVFGVPFLAFILLVYGTPVLVPNKQKQKKILFDGSQILLTIIIILFFVLIWK